MRRSLCTLLLLLQLARPGLGADCTVDELAKVDCWPTDYDKLNKDTCEQRGCCFVPVQGARLGMGTPECFFPKQFGYSVASRTALPGNGLQATLVQKPDSPAPYGGDVKTLNFTLEPLSDAILHFKLTDAQHARYEVPIAMPQEKLQPPTAGQALYSTSVASTGSVFSLRVARAADNSTVVDTTNMGGLVYSDQFIQWTSRLGSSYIYGLGEHVAPFLLNTSWQLLSLFSQDQGTPEGYTSLYGVHPVYLCIEPSGRAHGVFLLNSNAQDIVLQPTPAITYRTLGGVLDFYVLLGPTVDDVLMQYASVVGFPLMPAYWHLGFHLCRWGYNSANRTMQVVQAMRDNGIPQDVQWNDIDYMDKHLDFTYDPVAYAELPDVVRNLHDHNQHYIQIIDPGISSEQKPGSYPAFDSGISQKIFVTNSSGGVLIGKVWPGLTAFPDFLNKNTLSWWKEQIQTFQAAVGFDYGLWTDMNEASNFVLGSVDGCPQSPLEDPPYVPQNIAGGMLRHNTLCMTAQHGQHIGYNVHSLFGYSESVATATALRELGGKRSLVISRSTFANSGKYAGHWLGDNNSNWNDLKLSIAGILNFNMFAIPLVGADICGFGGSTTAELCARWMQLGAFYPFSRNHNTIGAPPQDPTAFGPQVAAISRDVLLTRYSLLPFLYTLFSNAWRQGAPVARALFYDFPTDKTTLSIDTQFMWGRALLITPVLTAGATTVKGYFPAGVWYDFYSGKAMQAEQGQWVELDAPLEKINLHLRAGTIVPMQAPATTTYAARQNPFELRVALDPACGTGSTTGSLYNDDGDSWSSPQDGRFLWVQFSATCSQNGLSGQLQSAVGAAVFTTSPPLQNITVYGVPAAPTSVTVGGQAAAFAFDAANLVLRVTQLALDLTQPFTLAWQH
eukprot:m.281612 g.281612  ORF g.281612 m.281612 type:complete len:898 (+) comp22892_c0_seq3:862-3555(+)